MPQLIGWPTASKATRLQAIADPAAPLRDQSVALTSNESRGVATTYNPITWDVSGTRSTMAARSPARSR
jgi:hypothetical protein